MRVSQLEHLRDSVEYVLQQENLPEDLRIRRFEESSGKLVETGRVSKILAFRGLEIQRHRTSREDMEYDGMAREGWLYRQYQDHVAAQTAIEQALRREGEQRGIPCVATNNCHYLKRDDWKAHEVLLNIQSGSTHGRPRHSNSASP